MDARSHDVPAEPFNREKSACGSVESVKGTKERERWRAATDEDEHYVYAIAL